MTEAFFLGLLSCCGGNPSHGYGRFPKFAFFVCGVFACECGDDGDEWAPVPRVHEIVNGEFKSNHRQDVPLTLSVINPYLWCLPYQPTYEAHSNHDCGIGGVLFVSFAVGKGLHDHGRAGISSFN